MIGSGSSLGIVLGKKIHRLSQSYFEAPKVNDVVVGRQRAFSVGSPSESRNVVVRPKLKRVFSENMMEESLDKESKDQLVKFRATASKHFGENIERQQKHQETTNFGHNFDSGQKLEEKLNLKEHEQRNSGESNQNENEDVVKKCCFIL